MTYNNSEKLIYMFGGIFTFCNLGYFVINWMFSYKFQANELIIYNIISLLIMIYYCVGYIIKIELKENNLIIYKLFKNYESDLKDIKYFEVEKITKSLKKYKILNIIFIKTNKKYKLNSYSWTKYEEIINNLKVR